MGYMGLPSEAQAVYGPRSLGAWAWLAGPWAWLAGPVYRLYGPRLGLYMGYMGLGA